MASRRALHFVFKIGDRNENIKFFKDILGMKVLRHEEFEAGCKATCNGPYDGKWSKTMIGYGPEDSHFVCELTYNYGISHYEIGNDFLGMHIQCSEAIERAKSCNIHVTKNGSEFTIKSPDGYPFHITHEPLPRDRDPVLKVSLASSVLDRSLKYWKELAGMKVFEESSSSALLGFDANQAKLLIKSIGCEVIHAKAFGRIAFSCPSAELKGIESGVKAAGHTIITPFVSLDTPGKTTVQVVILADPDNHEICFVGDEGFRDLSQVDPKGEELLNDAMAKDKSNEWFASKGGKGAA